MKQKILPALWKMAHLIFYFLKGRLIQLFPVCAVKRQNSILAWICYLTNYLHNMGRDFGMLITGYESIIKKIKWVRKNNLPNNLGMTVFYQQFFGRIHKIFQFIANMKFQFFLTWHPKALLGLSESKKRILLHLVEPAF